MDDETYFIVDDFHRSVRNLAEKRVAYSSATQAILAVGTGQGYSELLIPRGMPNFGSKERCHRGAWFCISEAAGGMGIGGAIEVPSAIALWGTTVVLLLSLNPSRQEGTVKRGQNHHTTVGRRPRLLY